MQSQDHLNSLETCPSLINSNIADTFSAEILKLWFMFTVKKTKTSKIKQKQLVHPKTGFQAFPTKCLNYPHLHNYKLEPMIFNF